MLGFERFLEYQEQVKVQGTEFHKDIELILTNQASKEIEAKPHLKQIIECIRTDIRDPVLIEAPVTHWNLLYTGRVDCVAYYKNTLCLIDWKSSEKSKKQQQLTDLYDVPVQISAYIGAFFNDPNLKHIRAKHKIENALIVYISKTTGELSIHPVNYQQAEFYWYEWLNSLRKFWYLVLKHKSKSFKS